MAKRVEESTWRNKRRAAAAVMGALLSLAILAILLGTLIPASRSSGADDDANNPEISTPSPAPPDAVLDEAEVLAFAPDPICYSHVPLETDLSRVCTDPATLPHGGPFCQLVAVAILNRTMGWLDLSLINGGAQRGDVLPGNFTAGMALRALPFLSNRVAIVTATGFQLVQTLEDSVAYSIQVVPLKVSLSAAYPYGAGVRFDVNLTAPYGRRVSGVEVDRRPPSSSGSAVGSSSSWEAIDLEARYGVVTNSYLAGGGDDYFRNVSKEDIVMTDLMFTDEFIDYCRDVDVLVSPTPEEMSTQMFTGLPQL